MLWILGIFLYFLPILCASKEHPNRTGLFMLNLFLGWTFIGWVVALVWAFSKKQVVQQIYYQQQELPREESISDKIIKARKLWYDGIITEEEFEKIKTRLIPSEKETEVQQEPNNTDSAPIENTPVGYLVMFYIKKYKHTIIIFLLLIAFAIYATIVNR